MIIRAALLLIVLCSTTSATAQTKNLSVAPTGLEIFRQLNSDVPPANIAVSQGGRVFLSTHLAYGPTLKVVELLADGTHRKYPNMDFHPPLNGVLGAIVDRKDIFWFLDTIWGKDGMGRVVGWDINKDELYKIIYIARPIVNDAYILNDMAVDRDNDAIYISETADEETSALLVVDLKTGLVRRVLSGSASTIPEDKPLIIDNKVVNMQGKEARVGVNPITIDINNEWVYFAPMSSESLYRIKTKDLLNQGLSPTQLEQRVERYSDKPMGDGMTIDSAGNIYVSDLAGNAIGVITTDRKYQTLFADSTLLSWTEGFANAGDQGIYATTNKLHRSPAFNNEKPTPNQFYIVRFKPMAFATFGR